MNVFSFKSEITISISGIQKKDGCCLKPLKNFPVFQGDSTRILQATLKDKSNNLFIRNVVQNLFMKYSKAGPFEKKPKKYSLDAVMTISSNDGFDYEGRVHINFYLSIDGDTIEFNQITLLENSHDVRKFLESKRPKKHY